MAVDGNSKITSPILQQKVKDQKYTRAICVNIKFCQYMLVLQKIQCGNVSFVLETVTTNYEKYGALQETTLVKY